MGVKVIYRWAKIIPIYLRILAKKASLLDSGVKYT